MYSPKREIVLSADDAGFLEAASKDESICQTSRTRARILLALHGGESGNRPFGRDIASSLGVTEVTVSNIKALYRKCDGDVRAVVLRKKREQGPRECKVTPFVEEKLVFLINSSSPKDGSHRWTTRGLALSLYDEYGIKVSHTTVMRTMKKLGIA
jgi:transposase